MLKVEKKLRQSLLPRSGVDLEGGDGEEKKGEETNDPFYKSLWFKIFVVVVILGAVLGFVFKPSGDAAKDGADSGKTADKTTDDNKVDASKYKFTSFKTEEFKKGYQQVRDDLMDSRGVIQEAMSMGKGTADRMKSALSDAKDLVDAKAFEEKDEEALKSSWEILTEHVTGFKKMYDDSEKKLEETKTKSADALKKDVPAYEKLLKAVNDKIDEQAKADKGKEGLETKLEALKKESKDFEDGVKALLKSQKEYLDATDKLVETFTKDMTDNSATSQEMAAEGWVDDTAIKMKAEDAGKYIEKLTKEWTKVQEAGQALYDGASAELKKLEKVLAE